MEEGDSSLSGQSPSFYVPLYRAILEDDWISAEAFIQNHPNCLRAGITKDQDTALHTAAVAKRTRFVKKLVRLMKPEELELKASNDYTALYFAAQTEIVTIAEVMVKKNKNLPSIFPKDNILALPLFAAIGTGNREMVSYLYSVTPIQDLTSGDRIQLLEATIYADLYDTALKILDKLKFAPEELEFVWILLKELARKPSEIGDKSQPSVWERYLNSCFRGRLFHKALMQASAHQLVDRLFKQLGDDKYSSSIVANNQRQLLVKAAEVGNIEFLIILIRSDPDLIEEIDLKGYSTLFHIAIKHRQERVFNLIYEIGVLKSNLATYHAEGRNNMLHLAGELPSLDRLNIVSGAALQMQREVLVVSRNRKARAEVICEREE